VLGREALDQRVRVDGPAHVEPPMALVGAVAVEDEDAPHPLAGDPAGKQVAQLAGGLEAARVQQVEAVEEVERGLSHRAQPPRSATLWRRAS